MTVFRSLVFTALFYVVMAIYLIVFLPIFVFTSQRFAWMVTRAWARSSLWLLRVVVGTKAAYSGHENLPKGAAIIAPKHQSYWETLALLPQLDRPAFVLKKELMNIPLFGLYAQRIGMIPVDRSKPRAALASMLVGARKAAAEGRHVVIFPEGTRTPPGEEGEYRAGVHFLYTQMKLPVVPVALNSGLYWPKSEGPHQAGTVRVEFLPAIEPGLPRDEIIGRLRAAIETRSLALLREAYLERADLPMSAKVAERLKEPV